MFPTKLGNIAVKDPNFIKNIQGFIDNNKAESAYFTELNGDRAGIFNIDMQQSRSFDTKKLVEA
jgi:hypothetical protein